MRTSQSVDAAKVRSFQHKRLELLVESIWPGTHKTIQDTAKIGGDERIFLSYKNT